MEKRSPFLALQDDAFIQSLSAGEWRSSLTEYSDTGVRSKDRRIDRDGRTQTTGTSWVAASQERKNTGVRSRTAASSEQSREE